MLEIDELFAERSARPSPTAGDLWTDRDRMQDWLGSVFDAILASPSRGTANIDVPPYRFLHDGRNLFSVSLLALLSLRPHDATLSQQDFEYLFCDAFLDYFDFQGDESESFVSWISTVIFRMAEEEEHLDFAPAEFIRDYLHYVAVRDPLLSRLRMTDRSNFLSLFVSILFTIHIGGLWPQLFDRIDGRSRPRLKLPFKLIEMFLNRFAEEELRFRTVTADNVKEAMQLLEFGVTHPDLEPREANVLRALRLAPGSASPSFVRKAGNAALRLGTWAYSLTGTGQTVRRRSEKRSADVKTLELDEVASRDGY